MSAVFISAQQQQENEDNHHHHHHRHRHHRHRHHRHHPHQQQQLQQRSKFTRKQRNFQRHELGCCLFFFCFSWGGSLECLLVVCFACADVVVYSGCIILSGSSTATIGVSCDLERWTGKSMADDMARSRVLTNELLHCGQTHSEPSRGSPRS